MGRVPVIADTAAVRRVNGAIENRTGSGNGARRRRRGYTCAVESRCNLGNVQLSRCSEPARVPDTEGPPRQDEASLPRGALVFLPENTAIAGIRVDLVEDERGNLAMRREHELEFIRLIRSLL